MKQYQTYRIKHIKQYQTYCIKHIWNGIKNVASDIQVVSNRSHNFQSFISCHQQVNQKYVRGNEYKNIFQLSFQFAL